MTADCCSKTLSMTECRESRYSECLERMGAESLRAGKGAFDADAAETCFPTISCKMTAPEDGFAQRKACANAATGAEPPGEQCGVDEACARAGEFAICYREKQHPVELGTCAAVVIDEDICAWSNDDHKLRLCPTDKFCDIRAAELTAPPDNAWRKLPTAYRAPCRARLPAGASCIDTRDEDSLLPCAEGLYCEVTGTNVATCVKQKPEGASCRLDFGVDECVEGFLCASNEEGEPTCQRLNRTRIACSTELPCGDGFCDRPTENQFNCPQDCQSCFDCACHRSASLVLAGCQHVCDQNAGGGEIPDFCNWAPASEACAACISDACGHEPSDCNL
ncbi:Hypothetical protein A7982_10809 [Minicystis rosea]|nr:Hypothetical protein A7982_10809 [Minicystis rosea]